MQPDHRSIGEWAYRLWQSRGCAAGTAEQDWLDVEKHLRAMQFSSAVQRATQTAKALPGESETVVGLLEGSFAATEPPASHSPDLPPANADAKWQAPGDLRKDLPRRSSRSRRSNPNSDATR